MENFKNDKKPDSLDLDELIKDYENSTNKDVEDLDVTRVFQPYTEKKVEKSIEPESKIFLNIDDIEDKDTGMTSPLEFNVDEEKDTPFTEEVQDREIPELPKLKSLDTNKKDKNLNIALTVVLSLIVVALVFGIGFIGYKALFDGDEAPEPEKPIVEEKPKDEPEEEKADATRLEDLINEASKISPTYYTADSFANLQSAIASAKLTVENESLTYEELTEAISKLKEAMRDLELKDKNSAKPPVTPDDGEEDKDKPDTEEPGTEEPGTDEPDTEEPDTEEPDTEEPGTDEPGTDEPGTDEPDTEEPGTEEPGNSTNGGEENPVTEPPVEEGAGVPELE